MAIDREANRLTHALVFEDRVEHVDADIGVIEPRRFCDSKALPLELMHDVGRLGLLAAEPNQYAKLLASVDGTSADMLLAEKWAFRIDHCEAGFFLAKTWGLPDEFWLPASQHHDIKNPTMTCNVDVIRLACALAHALGYKAAPKVQSEMPEVLLDEIPGLNLADPVSPLTIMSELLKREVGEALGVPEPCNA